MHSGMQGDSEHPKIHSRINLNLFERHSLNREPSPPDSLPNQLSRLLHFILTQKQNDFHPIDVH